MIPYRTPPPRQPIARRSLLRHVMPLARMVWRAWLGWRWHPLALYLAIVVAYTAHACAVQWPAVQP